MLRQKAKELSADPAFKASLGWYQNWKRHHSVSFRAKTTLAQRLPDDLEEKVVQFHWFVIAARQRVGYPLSHIFNMDETPMQFELPSSRSLEFTGSRTVAVKTCGAEKRQLHRGTCRRCRWNQTSTEGDLQRCPDSKRPRHFEFPPSFLPQKGMDERVGREGMDSPVFAENL